jgi:hypothetical protein
MGYYRLLRVTGNVNVSYQPGPKTIATTSRRQPSFSNYTFFHERTMAQSTSQDKGKVWGHSVPEIRSNRPQIELLARQA